ncbi:hypothetical protein BJ508DRAFT_315532 [Ascobolus immersus RN42]|uniref:Uncharacterized protein n=1 Tax=Ascobolus immersus RN42 TaxID=1160509 RepID=A0A3N4HAH2_ASCIM|nr:hypothetical protein BJ508DRAFT_315532 [Ascobolus immersus RN42]
MDFDQAKIMPHPQLQNRSRELGFRRASDAVGTAGLPGGNITRWIEPKRIESSVSIDTQGKKLVTVLGQYGMAVPPHSQNHQQSCLQGNRLGLFVFSDMAIYDSETSKPPQTAITIDSGFKKGLSYESHFDWRDSDPFTSQSPELPKMDPSHRCSGDDHGGNTGYSKAEDMEPRRFAAEREPEFTEGTVEHDTASETALARAGLPYLSIQSIPSTSGSLPSAATQQGSRLNPQAAVLVPLGQSTSAQFQQQPQDANQPGSPIGIGSRCRAFPSAL